VIDLGEQDRVVAAGLEIRVLGADYAALDQIASPAAASRDCSRSSTAPSMSVATTRPFA